MLTSIKVGPATLAAVREYDAQIAGLQQQMEAARVAGIRLLLAVIEQAGGDTVKSWKLHGDTLVLEGAEAVELNPSEVRLGGPVAMPKPRARREPNADTDGLPDLGKAPAM